MGETMAHYGEDRSEFDELLDDLLGDINDYDYVSSYPPVSSELRNHVRRQLDRESEKSYHTMVQREDGTVEDPFASPFEREARADPGLNNRIYGKMGEPMGITINKTPNTSKVKKRCICSACRKPTDMFIMGGIVGQGLDSGLDTKVQTIFCSACIVNMKKALDKKYKIPNEPKPDEDNPWEAWSTPSDES